MNMKSLFKTQAVLIVIFCMPFLSNAQPGDGGIDADPNPPSGAGAPFDGGLSILIAAGIGYAAKKGYDKRLSEKAKGN